MERKVLNDSEKYSRKKRTGWKPLRIFITACLLVGMFPAAVFAAGSDIVTYPVTGGNIYFNKSTGTITDCDQSVTEAVIPEEIEGVPVTGIGGYAFSGCSSLSSIEIPEGVTEIGDSAFVGCNNLNRIIIPESVEEIGNEEFVGCRSLKTAGPIGSGCNYEFGWKEIIPDNAFHGCQELNSVIIPESITEIGSDAFYGCWNLYIITLPENLEKIGDEAFYACGGLESITIPESVIEIGERAFSECNNLSSIIIPKSVNKIGDSAFYGCIDLQTAGLIGSGCNYEFGWNEKIPDHAFDGCKNLSSIRIPESIVEIGNYAFDGCDSLKTAGTIGSGCNYEFGWKEIIPDNAFYGCGIDSIRIPESITKIGKYAFYGCSSLSSITIPQGITEIEDSTFYECYNLSNVTIPESVTAIKSYAFYGCRSLNKIEIPKSMQEIDHHAFSECSSLVSLIIPENVTSIGVSAFEYCSNLNNISIPESVTAIGYSVFEGCSSLSDIYYTGSEEQWSAISIGTDNDPLTEAAIHFNSEMPGETSSEQGLHIYTDVPSRIVTVEDTFSVGAVMIDENGNDTDLSDITFIVEDDNILRAQDVYEKDNVLYCSFRANSAGTTRIRVRDANADRAATISFTVEPVAGDAYTVNNFQDTYKNGIQIKNSRVSENSDGSYNISFDAYNSLYLYGAVEVYDADGQLQNAEYLDKWTDVAGIKDVVSYICEIALVSVGQTYWKELASAETHIDVRVPKGGYILISANPKESVVCSMLNSMDLIWQYMDYMGKLKGSLSSEKQLPKVIIQKIQEESDSFPQKWMKAFFNEAFQKSITSEAGIQDFIKSLVNVLMSNDLDQMVAGTLAETLEGSATDLFTDWFTTASGPAGIAINGIFSVSGASNTVIQTIQFCKYSEARFITVQVPDGDKRVNSDITVDCDMNDDTALSVYKIDVEESKKYLVNIADIENQNVKPGNPEDGPGYQRPVDPSSVDIWAAYDIRLVDGEDEYVPENGAEVILPLPEELRGYIGKVKVYRIDENGDTTVLWGVSDGTRVSVVTDHFSVYIIASTSVDQNSIEGGYNIDSLQILDSDGQVLNSIPSGEFYVEADLSKSDKAEDAVLVLAAYDSDGKMLRLYCENLGDVETAETDTDSTVSRKIRVENPDSEVAEVRTFVLRSLGMPVSLCPAVSVGNSSAMN